MQYFVKKQDLNPSNMDKDLRKLFEDFSVYHQAEILSLIQLYVPEWNPKALHALVLSLINMYWKIDNSMNFLSSSARRRSTIIIWESLQRLEVESFQHIINELEHSYDLLEMINDVSHWFEKDSSGINQSGRMELWQQLEDNLVTEILTNKINLYDDAYYHRHNIWGMLRNMKDDEAGFKAYIATVVSSHNVFRLLADMIGSSVGREYRYYFTEQTINYFTDEDRLNELLENAIPHSEDEEFLTQLYYLCMSNKGEAMEDRGLICAEERKFSRL